MSRIYVVEMLTDRKGGRRRKDLWEPCEAASTERGKAMAMKREYVPRNRDDSFRIRVYGPAK